MDEEMVTISAPLAALSKQPSMPTALHLIDTPGPNEAGEEGLKYQASCTTCQHLLNLQD